MTPLPIVGTVLLLFYQPIQFIIPFHFDNSPVTPAKYRFWLISFKGIEEHYPTAFDYHLSELCQTRLVPTPKRAKNVFATAPMKGKIKYATSQRL